MVNALLLAYLAIAALIGYGAGFAVIGWMEEFPPVWNWPVPPHWLAVLLSLAVGALVALAAGCAALSAALWPFVQRMWSAAGSFPHKP